MKDGIAQGNMRQWDAPLVEQYYEEALIWKRDSYQVALTIEWIQEWSILDP